MGLLERVEAHRAAVQNRWPVGSGVVERYETVRGHDDSRFSPESYGDYIATSNEIYSIINLRSRLIGRLPIRLYDEDGPDRTEVTKGDLHALLRHVNPFWTAVRLKQQTEMSLGLWGEAYWVLERDRRGVPVEIWWVKPSQMFPVPHPTEYLSGYLFKPGDGTKEIPFRPDEVIWFRYPNPIDEYSGLSPLAAARLAADTASAMMTSNRRLFEHGMQLAGVITPPDSVTYSPEQATALEKQLEERFRGVDKAHRWAVLRFQTQVQPFGVTPKDAEFVNGLNVTLRQACNAYGIPAPLMNDLEHATLANAREFHTILWENTLAPECEFLSEEMREQLLPQFPRTRPAANHVEFDLSRVAALREAENSIWEREAGQIDKGALTINEWRKRHGLPEVPWGDVWWAPVNKAPIEDEGRVGPAVAPSQQDGDFQPPAPADMGGMDDEDVEAFLDLLTAVGPRSNGHH